MAVDLSLIKSSRILIVDDNESNVMLLEGMLEQDGYQNVHSTTRSRDVAPLQARHDFDLILLDIQMPQMDGFEVMDALREQSCEEDYLSVLVLSAQTDMTTRLRSLDAGARDFINKPFQHSEVLQRIHNCLEIRHLYKAQKNQNQSLEDQVQKATEKVRSTQLDLIRCLGRAGEYRDNETGDHVIRMSKYCQMLALEYGLSQKEARLILYASPMHDVGKIAIPDRILLKPGKLNEEEWAVMKTHAQLGADILCDNGSEIIQMARLIALSHHEKWDGSGYPNGLKGSAIPLVGRITAICDVFDALTSDRSYKKAWDINQACDYIQSQAGHHFDPELVHHFNNILAKILMIRQHHQVTSSPSIAI